MRQISGRYLDQLHHHLEAALEDPVSAFTRLAIIFEELAEGPEDDVRVVKAARASVKALKAEAARWRRL